MFKKHVLETIKKYNLIEQNDKIVCAVSGGPDSICMLDILRRIKEEKQINFDIIVCHINHMIRVEATADEQYVENYCKKYKIPFFAKRVDVKKIAEANKQGTEEAGRKVRYDFFEEIFQKENATKIAIAHNKNDKIETIIMNVFRGSGIAGLRGIEPIRDNRFIRPLIEIERAEIEAYCEENSLNPRIDKTNFINDVTRNKIRNIVIPYIKDEFNPNFINTLDRLSNVITEEDEYMKKKTIEIYNKIKVKEKEGYIILNLKEFNIQDEVIRKRLIIYTIAQTIGSAQNIEKVNIEDIIKLCLNNIGNKYLTPNKNIKISVGKGQVVFEKI